ncbi:MAG: multiheme c-type cytochrome [Planctomycetaceae bacterium]
MICEQVRNPVLGVRALGLLAVCLLAVCGCNGQSASHRPASGEDSAGVTNEAGSSGAADRGAVANSAAQSRAEVPRSENPQLGAFLADWSPPAAAILLTGEQTGRLEPCGCSERQSGGLSRRADFARQLRERGWPVTGFDLGGAVQRNRRQSELKYEFTRDALNRIGYQGLGFGLQDLRFGPEKLYDWVTRTNVEPGFDVPFLSANVTFFDTREIGTPISYRVVTVGDVKIAVTSVFGLSYLPDLFPGAVNPNPTEIRIDVPAEVLPSVVEQMQAEQPDVMLLMAYAKPDESRELAKAFPQFDLVVTAGGPEDPDGQAESVNQALLLRVGTKGKNCGIVGYYPAAEDGKKFRFEVVELDRFRFGHAEAIDERMWVYQQQLQAENLLETEPAIVHPRGSDVQFVGSEKCAACHADAYNVWEGSEHHLHGFESLTVAYAQASDDPSLAARVRVDRIHDPECICCHTAGWDPQEVLRFETGYFSETGSAHLKGVHCESCHGPGSRHVEREESGNAVEADLLVERAGLSIRKQEAEAKVCLKCHDHENSPDFEFEKYWAQIEH